MLRNDAESVKFSKIRHGYMQYTPYGGSLMFRGFEFKLHGYCSFLICKQVVQNNHVLKHMTV